LKINKFIGIWLDFQFLKTEFYFDIMNIEVEKLLFILIEKIDEDIIILFENHEVENLFLYDI
jgi:hypothetical protein